MKKLINNSVLAIILLIGLTACKDKYANLHPDLVKNLQVLEKDEFLAKIDFDESLFFEGELISETKGEQYGFFNRLTSCGCFRLRGYK